MEGKKLFLLASETYGGAERNLLTVALAKDHVYTSQRKNVVTLLFQVFRILSNDRGISVIVPLGRKNTIVALALSIFQKRLGVIYSIRATELQRGYYSYVLDRFLLRLTDKVKIVSNSFAGALVFSVKLGIPVDEIDIVYNRQKAIQIDQSTINIRLLVVGHNRIEKGYDLLPELLAAYQDLGINMSIDIYGSETEKIKSCQGINPMGYVNSKDIPWNNYDALLNVSYDEGLPTVFLEAGQRGIPIIARRTSGVFEYICEGLNGVIIDLNDNVQSAQKIKLFFPSFEFDEILRRHENFMVTTKKLSNVFVSND